MYAGRKNLLKIEENQSSGWKIAFSGFVLILLSFFITMNSFSTIEKGRAKCAIKSFREAINIEGVSNPKINYGIKENSEDIFENNSSSLKEERHTLAKEEFSYTDIKRKNSKLAMKVEPPILFEEGTDKIMTASLPLLEKIGNTIKNKPYKIHIIGYAQIKSNNTSHTYLNWKISIARAVSVLRYFIEKMNIPEEKITAEGLGQFRAIDEISNFEKDKLNNFVEIIIHKDGFSRRNKDDR